MIHNLSTRHHQWKLLDCYRRKLFVKYELKYKMLNSISKNSSLPLIYRYNAAFRKSLIPRSASITKHSNRCVRTGRNWNVLKKTNYSRFVFRSESYKGHLPGLKRASW